MSTYDATGRAHRPAGAPASTGGQFAHQPKAESTTRLADESPSPRHVADANALNEIALCLGRDSEWDGSADYLDAIADEVSGTGRPHPGADDYGAGTYDTALDAWKAANPVDVDDPGYRDWSELNTLASHLGTADAWSSDDLDAAASAIEGSGRPNPGDDLFGRAYERELEGWRAEHGPLAARHPYAKAVREAGYPALTELIDTAWERDLDGDSITEAGLESITAEDAQRWGESLTRAMDRAVRAMDPDDFPPARDLTGEEADEAERHLADVCAEAGLPCMEEALMMRVETGDLPRNWLFEFDAAGIDDLYFTRVAPVVDQIGNDLTERSRGL